MMNCVLIRMLENGFCIYTVLAYFFRMAEIQGQSPPSNTREDQSFRPHGIGRKKDNKSILIIFKINRKEEITFAYYTYLLCRLIPMCFLSIFQAFEQVIRTSIRTYVSLSGQVAPIVRRQAEVVDDLFRVQRDFLLSSCKNRTPSAGTRCCSVCAVC